MSDNAMPAYLETIAPAIGTTWEWEPLKPYARSLLRVTNVHWNGKECWIQSELLCRNVVYNAAAGYKKVWNELSRWVEATILIESRDA